MEGVGGITGVGVVVGGGAGGEGGDGFAGIGGLPPSLFLTKGGGKTPSNRVFWRVVLSACRLVLPRVAG